MIAASDTPCPTLSFLPGGTVCCDAHDEGVTRAELREHFHAGTRIVHGYEFPDHTRLLRAASATGTHPDDMRGFSVGRTSLTAPARSRLRSYLREQRAAQVVDQCNTASTQAKDASTPPEPAKSSTTPQGLKVQRATEAVGWITSVGPPTSGLYQHGERIKVRTGAEWGDSE